MSNTFNDFWKMIWQQNCSIIVMITNVREKGRVGAFFNCLKSLLNIIIYVYFLDKM
jgi:protein tyrosine phosphatase